MTEDFSIEMTDLTTPNSTTEKDHCELCGYSTKSSEMCPACGDSPAAATRLDDLRSGGDA